MKIYEDNHIKIYNKDCRAMTELPDNSVQCVVTSPPYWGLRKYSGEQELIWGDNHCEHQWRESLAPGRIQRDWSSGERTISKGSISAQYDEKFDKALPGNFCSLCGAWKGAYGLEPTPEMYIQHTIEILREIRRVLRKDGVVFWNIGDSYVGGKGQSGVESQEYQDSRVARGESLNRVQQTGGPGETRALDNLKTLRASGLKPKDLYLIPFRLAIAAQEDGWWVRSVIIWSKPNPMPESVTDRPTESHEYILMLTKSARYYWDGDAVREPISESYADDKRPHGVLRQRFYPNSKYVKAGMMKHDSSPFPTGERATGRNIRSVWEFPTQPYPEAHFAVFPEKLPEICIKAATPEVGCCSKCGAPWERITEITQIKISNSPLGNRRADAKRTNLQGIIERLDVPQQRTRKEIETIGWQPTCKCNADKVPSIVLDPFMGAGTTLWVAKKLNRQAVGYEISKEYCNLAIERNRQQALL